MTYLAVIDRDHLDNAMFLTTLAQSLDRHDYDEHNCIIIHGDSEYTDRIMQTGVMREEAVKRSIRGLNHRLINLLADEGISAIGLNGFQRQLITRKSGGVDLDTSYLNSLPTTPVWLISSLIQDLDREERAPLELPRLARLISEEFHLDRIYLFARTEESLFDQMKAGSHHKWEELSDHFKETYLPAEFQDFASPIRLTTGKKFGDPDENYLDIG